MSRPVVARSSSTRKVVSQTPPGSSRPRPTGGSLEEGGGQEGGYRGGRTGQEGGQLERGY